MEKAEKGAILNNGEFLSPKTAAGSILDYVRTTKFLRGIKKAIDYQLNILGKNKIVIMYAQPGPYAELILPLLPLYKNNQLSINIIGFHKQSIDAVHSLISHFELNDYFDEIINDDPMQYERNNVNKFDLLIIETIQKALITEPQIALTNHFSKFLADDGSLIPEQIKVSASLADLPTELAFSSSKWTNFWLNIKRKNAFNNRIFLNDVLNVDKNITKKQKLSDLPNKQIILDSVIIKDNTGRMKNLILLTEIKIFDDVILSEEDDTGITKPYYDRNVPSIELGMTINFSYQLGSYPRFLMSVTM